MKTVYYWVRYVIFLKQNNLSISLSILVNYIENIRTT